MKKFYWMMVLALMASTNVLADDFTTDGDGTTWTMTKLAEADGTGVSQEGSVFTMANTVVVAQGDYFLLEGGITVKMGQKVSLEIEGAASMAPQERSLFTRSDEGVVPGLVYLKSENSMTLVQHVDFEYTGLKYYASRGLCVTDCTFRYHEASTANGTSALNLAGEGASFVVSNCVFEKNKRAAIGGAANASNPITVENCQFLYNDQQNLNYPQLNLTAAENVIVRNNVVKGDRDMTRGGGIMVADLMGVAQNPVTLVEGNDVSDNRYGIALYSGQKGFIRDNNVVNNNTETTPANGGSGINIYDTTGTQQTLITGNNIEGNLWGVTIIGGGQINLGKVDETDNGWQWAPGNNTFYNNGNGGVIYDVYNNSANTVYAQGNYWKSAETQDAEGIEAVIFHQVDNASLGEVIFTPWADATTVGIYQTAVTVEAPAEQVFSLSGVRQNGLHKGLNIVRRGSTTVKVMR